jgi:nitroreductase
MNEVLEALHARKSVRAYTKQEITPNVKQTIIEGAMSAPTAGNMMLYSIIEVTDQELKDKLAHTCDDQPFIAKSPFVLIFLADYQRWFDYYRYSKVEEVCEGQAIRKPGVGDFLLACNDALIAAQTAVIVAESLGLGSCYIGDIMENYEEHQKLLDLPPYVFPITMLCFGYPTEGQKMRQKPKRMNQKFLVYENKYEPLDEALMKELDDELQEDMQGVSLLGKAKNLGQHYYLKKFSADFTKEMTRSVSQALKNWE